MQLATAIPGQRGYVRTFGCLRSVGSLDWGSCRSLNRWVADHGLSCNARLGWCGSAGDRLPAHVVRVCSWIVHREGDLQMEPDSLYGCDEDLLPYALVVERQKTYPVEDWPGSHEDWLVKGDH